jgi:hypothetical protein
MSITSKVAKTPKELSNKMKVVELQTAIQDEQQKRVNEFGAKLEALKKEFNCEIFCKRTEAGLGTNVQIQYEVILQANPLK